MTGRGLSGAGPGPGAGGFAGPGPGEVCVSSALRSRSLSWSPVVAAPPRTAAGQAPRATRRAFSGIVGGQRRGPANPGADERPGRAAENERDMCVSVGVSDDAHDDLGALLRLAADTHIGQAGPSEATSRRYVIRTWAGVARPQRVFSGRPASRAPSATRSPGNPATRRPRQRCRRCQRSRSQRQGSRTARAEGEQAPGRRTRSVGDRPGQLPGRCGGHSNSFGTTRLRSRPSSVRVSSAAARMVLLTPPERFFLPEPRALTPSASGQ